MRPVLFTWSRVRVHSYPALLYLGLVSGLYVTYLIAPDLGLPPEAAATATLILFVPALVGARAWFLLAHWRDYRGRLQRIGRRSEGGLALYGGLVLALAVSPAVLSPLRLPFARFWDAATFAILVGMLFTRVGCLLTGCCSGRATNSPLALELPDPTGRTERRYPVQLLELGAGALLLGGAFAMLAAGTPPGSLPPGSLFGSALAAYGGVRLALDPLREARPAGMASYRFLLAAFVLCSLVAVLGGCLLST